jgi:Arc/MetJ-type ribon-helix-helix transcriptional regulator
MAYIKERGAYVRVEIRRRGYKPVYRTFDTREQAKKWARRVEAEIDAGLYFDRSEAERTTLREALERYQREVVPNKRHPKQEIQRIARWMKNDLAYRMLADVLPINSAS